MQAERDETVLAKLRAKVASMTAERDALAQQVHQRPLWHPWRLCVAALRGGSAWLAGSPESLAGLASPCHVGGRARGSAEEVRGRSAGV